MEGMNSAGDDFPVATLLGIALLDSTGDTLPESTGDNSSNSTGDKKISNSTGDIYILYTPLGMTRPLSADDR